jgi:hypothetical protein
MAPYCPPRRPVVYAAKRNDETAMEHALAPSGSLSWIDHARELGIDQRLSDLGLLQKLPELLASLLKLCAALRKFLNGEIFLAQ